VPNKPISQNDNRDPGSSQERAESGWASTARLLGKVGGIGWFVATTIAISAFAGYWLDKQFDTAPVLTIVVLALGVLTAFVGMFRLLCSVREER